MPLPMTFAAFLASRREVLRKTQAEIAAACGITAEAVSQFECSHRKPRLSILPRLADALRVNRTTLSRYALQSRAPEFYDTLGLPLVEQKDLESAGKRTPASNPLLEDDEEEDRDGSNWTRRAEGQTLLDIEETPEAGEQPC